MTPPSLRPASSQASHRFNFLCDTPAIHRSGQHSKLSMLTISRLAHRAPRCVNVGAYRTHPARHVATLHASEAGSTQIGRHALALLSVGVVLGGMTIFTLRNPVYLDSTPPPSPTSPSRAPHASPDARQSARALIPYGTLQQHASRASAWVLIDGEVYDATSILDTHPGGIGPLLKNAGKDATKAFKPIHPPGTLASLPPSAHIGSIDPATVPRTSREPSPEERRIAKAREALPPPAAVLNLLEIETLAKGVLSSTAWAYYRSAGDDENSFNENREAFARFWFRPRVLRKISATSTDTTFFGLRTTLPIFIAPAALARLGHPDGEMNLVRAAGKAGILQGISNNASCSTEEIMSVKRSEQQLMFQLYMNKDRAASQTLISGLAAAGFAALILTVDAAVPGKRELDQRTKGEDFSGPAHGKTATGDGGGVAHAIGGYQDPDVCWEDIPWIRSLTNLPLIIKGIQCVEDAEIAFDEYGADGIILSNHGGRELDFSPAAITVLHELHERRPDLLAQHDVLIDGGITRGTDVLKALCLGARGVGLGRAFLFANGLWGEEGCSRVIDIMREEIVTGMRLMGVTRLDELKPEMVRYMERGGLAKARL
ncbi:hypothetical protein FA95DRAFT_658966 [Auriscalpium vulgare]|uniref:Uncharacterized protein n=1 Tax=Auriscalpium vulgare TaxID=40419 RepID=A0ACB8S1M8_9AGAM|nr:hypothetical protein FA95DRAFT_658966 [Auriscalpium vulgare]